MKKTLKSTGVLSLFLFLSLLFNPLSAIAADIQYFYYDDGQIKKVIYENGTAVEYIYDGAGNRLAKTTGPTSGTPNNPPSIPIYTSPANNTINVSQRAALSWNASTDPDTGDSVFYDIYISTVNPPRIFMNGHNVASLELFFAPSTIYYWKVVARDNHNTSSAGPVWSFTTGTGLDTDNDLIADANDNCPTVYNPDQTDTDIDRIGDACDDDDDNDGVPDINDNAPLNRYSCRDFDVDFCDDCSTGTYNLANDGTDTDSDGKCDFGDIDDDNDGLGDGADIDQLNPYMCEDIDSDTCDDCTIGVDGFGSQHDYTPANDGTDTDSDGRCDASDTDNDNDGIEDVNDSCPTGDIGWTSDATTDNDFDGCRDAGIEDQDDDNDLIIDYEEGVFGTNPLNPDTDGDGVDDLRDAFNQDNTESSDSDKIETPIITWPNDLSSPAISGDKIVWGDYNDGNYDIYVYDLSNNEERRITNDTSNQFGTRISGNRIVWGEQWRQGNMYLYDIYSYDLFNNQKIRITTDSVPDIYPPMISGDKIVWAANWNDNYDIYMYDLSKNEEIRITNDTSNQYSPMIFGNRIVWTNYNDIDGVSNISIYDISTKQETRLTIPQEAPWVTGISGDMIVFENYINDVVEIYVYNISTHAERLIKSGANIGYSKIYGDIITWQDYQNDKYDIYLYDLSDVSNEERKITTDLSQPGEQSMSGDKMVWDDYREGNWDIYMYAGDGVGDNTDNCPDIYNPEADWTDIHGDPHTDEQPDYDLDNIGDACDTDDDNDGALDTDDSNDNNPNVCNDSDSDTCDDCISGADDHVNDGVDYDTDGLCDAGDPDDDNDGALDENDCNDNDSNIYPGGPPVRIISTPNIYFSTLQAAYDAAGNNDVIQSQAVSFIGNFNANRNISVTFEPGYDCGFSNRTGTTGLN